MCSIWLSKLWKACMFCGHSWLAWVWWAFGLLEILLVTRYSIELNIVVRQGVRCGVVIPWLKTIDRVLVRLKRRSGNYQWWLILPLVKTWQSRQTVLRPIENQLPSKFTNMVPSVVTPIEPIERVSRIQLSVGKVSLLAWQKGCYNFSYSTPSRFNLTLQIVWLNNDSNERYLASSLLNSLKLRLLSATESLRGSRSKTSRMVSSTFSNESIPASLRRTLPFLSIITVWGTVPP